MNFTTKEETQILQAIKNLKQKYGIDGLNGEYLVTKDIDGDLEIAPVGIMDKLLWRSGCANANNFVKIKELINK